MNYSATADTVFNYVLGSLTGTYQQFVYAKGSFTISSTSITIQKNWTALTIEGKLTAANGLNAPLIKQTPNDVLYGVTLDLTKCELDGNSAGQSSNDACGINFTRHSGGVPYGVSNYPAITVKGGFIQDCYSQGVYCNFDLSSDGGELFFDHTTVQACGATDTTGFGGAQVVWYGVCDSQWIGGLIGGDNTNFAFLGLTLSSDYIKPDYINGHSKLVNIDGCTVDFVYSDNSGDFSTLELCQVETSRFSGVFNKAGGTNNTYPAISMDVYGTQNLHNDFSNLVFKYYSTSSMFNYGVEETSAAQNFNSYGSLNGWVGNFTVRVLGAGSNCTGSVVGGIAWS